MKTIRWLHISDLHLNYTNDEIERMRLQLVPFLKTLNCDFDYIFCTGDIRHKGQPYTEYSVDYLKNLCDGLSVPLDHLFVIPGNHDIDREESYKVSAMTEIYDEEKGYAQSNGSFSASQLERLFHGKEAFNGYIEKLFADFPERKEKYIDPLHPHFLVVTEDVNVIHLDSTLAYGKISNGEKHERDLFVGTDLLKETLTGLDPLKPSILLTHYSFEFLEQYEKKAVAKIMRDTNTRLWLAGHEHDGESQIKRDSFYEFLSGTLMIEKKSLSCVLIGELTLDPPFGFVQCFAWDIDQGWSEKEYFTHVGDDPSRYPFDLDPFTIERATDITAIEAFDDTVLLRDSHFVRRESDLQLLLQILEQEKKCAIIGMGGIGKTALAKRAASLLQDQNKRVFFVPCHISIAHGVSRNVHLPYTRRKKVDGVWETDEQYSYRILNIFLTHPDMDVMLVFDNVKMEDEFASVILQLKQYSIITTRESMNCWGIPELSLLSMNLDDQKVLFETYYGRKLIGSEIEVFEKISRKVCGHTLTLQLIARQCVASDWSLDEMLEKLEKTGVYSEDPTRFRYGESQEERNMYGHICALWDLAALSPLESKILQGLSLLPAQGVQKREFNNWMELGSLNEINRLIHLCWIELSKNDSGERLISLHPVIADVIHQELYLKQNTDLKKYAENLLEQVKNRDAVVEKRMRDISFGEYMFSRLKPSIEAIWFGLGLSMEEEYHRDCKKGLSQLNTVALYVDMLGCKNTIVEGHLYNNRGAIYQTLGEAKKALRAFNTASDIYRMNGKEMLPNYAYALHNIAKIYLGQGNYKKAKEIEQIAEPLLRKTWIIHWGEAYDLFAACCDSRISKLYNSPCFNKYKVRQLLKEELSLWTRAVEIKMRYAADNQQGIMISKANRACTLSYFKEPAALTEMTEVLDYYIKTTGSESGHVGEAYSKLCMVNEKLGNKSQAIACGERAVELLAKTFGTSSPEYKNAVKNLSIARE